MNKAKLADAKFREALTKAKLCRSRFQRAKKSLNDANAYLSHVQWTLQRSQYKDVLLQRSSHVVTVMDGELHGMQGMCTALPDRIRLTVLGVVNHFVDIPGGTLAIALD